MNIYHKEAIDSYPNTPRIELQEGDFLNYIDIPDVNGFVRADILEDWTIAVMASFQTEEVGKFDTLLAVVPFDDYRNLCLTLDEQTGESILGFLRQYPVRLNYIHRFTVLVEE
jgi:hypothetical protein